VNRIKNISLSSLQEKIQQILLTPLLQKHQKEFINTEVQSSARMSAKAHLGVYQRSYVMRLQQCMGSQFSALKFALGDDIFHLFSRQYLHTYPSKHYSLNNLGDDFSLFLEQTRPDAQHEVKEDWPDFMIELAEFEYNLNLLFDLEIPGSPLDHEQIQASSTTIDSQLNLVPVLKLFCQKHPIFDYYRAFNAQQQPELALPKTSYGLIIRRNYRLGLIDLSNSQYLFIKSFLNSQNIETAKLALVENGDNDKRVVEGLWQSCRSYLIKMGVFNQAII
jgi:hypothetical protein